MYFLSNEEKEHWVTLSKTLSRAKLIPSKYKSEIQSGHFGMFCFYMGTTLSAKGDLDAGLAWLKEGSFQEADGIFSNAYLTGFLTRHDNKLEMPSVCFEDPRPYVHFTTTPSHKGAREQFVNYCTRTLPDFSRPVSFMDIGTGNGTLLVDVLQNLLQTGKIQDIEEILIIDSSSAMLSLAHKTLSDALPGCPIKTINDKIQAVASNLDRHYDIAMSSLAYHHMPYETKLHHAMEMEPEIDHFLLFELDADNDTGEQFSPELACSVYQSYGRLIDFMFSHDAPVDVATSAVDNFLMVEEVSFFTQPRGQRTDYHMLRNQWHSLFREAFGSGFSCWSDATCYSDEFLDLFALHYGRN